MGGDHLLLALVGGVSIQCPATGQYRREFGADHLRQRCLLRLLDSALLHPERINGVATSFDASVSGGFTGLHARWIIERTQEGNNYPPLADFNSTAFSDANAEQGSTWNDVGNWALLTLMWMLGLPWRAHSPSSVGVFGAQMAA